MARPAKALIGATLALAIGAGLASGCGGGDGSDAGAEPSAAEWRTWVLPSGAAAGVPPPPAPASRRALRDERALRRSVAARTPAQERIIRRWDRAPVTAAWMGRAMHFVALRPKNPPYSSRAYAYVAVAMYDAVVSSWYWKQRYRRRAPSEDPLVEDPADPSYPDEHAALAAAAARVLAYLFPERPAQRLWRDAREAARSRVAAGVAYPSDVAAGLRLGRAVGDRVVAYAKRDGIARRWDGTRPRHTPTYWDPPPGSAARPVEPMAGRWRTWVMRSGDQFRPPPPPRYGSPRFRKAVRRLISAKQELTPNQRRLAQFWAGGQGTPLPAGIWEAVISDYLATRDLSIPQQARVVALASVAMADAGVAAWDAKYRYWYPRPENAIRDSGADPRWRPLIPTPFFPAYVSGHATYSAAVAEVLSYLFPEDSETWEKKAIQAAKARIWGGIHWPFDSSVGLAMGRKVGRLVVEHAKSDGAER